MPKIDRGNVEDSVIFIANLKFVHNENERYIY